MKRTFKTLLCAAAAASLCVTGAAFAAGDTGAKTGAAAEETTKAEESKTEGSDAEEAEEASLAAGSVTFCAPEGWTVKSLDEESEIMTLAPEEAAASLEVLWDVNESYAELTEEEQKAMADQSMESFAEDAEDFEITWQTPACEVNGMTVLRIQGESEKEGFCADSIFLFCDDQLTIFSFTFDLDSWSVKDMRLADALLAGCQKGAETAAGLDLGDAELIYFEENEAEIPDIIDVTVTGMNMYSQVAPYNSTSDPDYEDIEDESYFVMTGTIENLTGGTIYPASGLYAVIQMDGKEVYTGEVRVMDATEENYVDTISADTTSSFDFIVSIPDEVASTATSAAIYIGCSLSTTPASLEDCDYILIAE